MRPPDAAEQALSTLAQPICARIGVELVDVRFVTERGERIARIMLDRERTDGLPGSGVSVDDCQQVSRALSVQLDEQPELIPGAFRLEVSSPGLERPLVRVADFQRFVGREASVRTLQPIDERRNFEGTLLGTDGANVRISCSGREYLVPHESIAKANLVHRFS